MFNYIIFNMKQTPKLFLILLVAFIPINVMAKVKCPDYSGPKNKKFIDVATNYNINPPYEFGTFKHGAMEIYSSQLMAVIAPNCTVADVNKALKKISACIYDSKAKEPNVIISFPPVDSEEKLRSLEKLLEKSGCFRRVTSISIDQPIGH